MIYIDSNIFVLAAMDSEKRGEAARKIIQDTIVGKIQAATSVLTIEEVAWTLWKINNDKTKAVHHARNLMLMKNIRILSIDTQIMFKAFDLLKKYEHLRNRDAIHISVAVSNNIETVVSDDKDFKAVREIKWKSLIT